MPEEIPHSLDSQAMISLRDLRVNYGDREILHGISFDVLHGETLVILGGSGAGKSTLLRTLVGLEKPTSGEIWIKGKNIAALSESALDEIRKKIGMSFQGGALFGSMTVGENVALPLREHTKLEDSTIQIVLRLKLEQVGLEGFEYYMPSQLSGGMKKRAAVLPHDHHRCHPRASQCLPDCRSHGAHRQRQHRSHRHARRYAREHAAPRQAIFRPCPRARSCARVGLSSNAY